MLLIFGHKRKLSGNMKKFVKNVDDFNAENKDKLYMCPPDTDPQLAFNCLRDLLLGEDWYVTMPLGRNQINTVALDEILHKYCKEYRK